MTKQQNARIARAAYEAHRARWPNLPTWQQVLEEQGEELKAWLALAQATLGEVLLLGQEERKEHPLLFSRSEEPGVTLTADQMWNRIDAAEQRLTVAHHASCKDPQSVHVRAECLDCRSYCESEGLPFLQPRRAG